MSEFRITPTPHTLDTYGGDVERVVSGEWVDGMFALVVETTSAEGYSVPVRLTFDRERLTDLLGHPALFDGMGEAP